MAKVISLIQTFQTYPFALAEAGSTVRMAESDMVENQNPPWGTDCLRLSQAKNGRIYRTPDVAAADDIIMGAWFKFDDLSIDAAGDQWMFWSLEVAGVGRVISFNITRNGAADHKVYVLDKNDNEVLWGGADGFDNLFTEDEWCRIEVRVPRIADGYLDVWFTNESGTRLLTIQMDDGGVFDTGAGDVRMVFEGQGGAAAIGNPTTTYVACAYLAGGGVGGTADFLGPFGPLLCLTGKVGRTPDCEDDGTVDALEDLQVGDSWIDLSDGNDATQCQYAFGKGGAVKFDDGDTAGPNGRDLDGGTIIAGKWMWKGAGTGQRNEVDVVWGYHNGGTYVVTKTASPGVNDFYAMQTQDSTEAPKRAPEASDEFVIGFGNSAGFRVPPPLVTMDEMWGVCLLQYPSPSTQIASLGKILDKTKIVL